MPRTLLISAFQAHVSKNILNTDALAQLKSKEDLRIVILTIPEKVDFFKKIYCDEKTEVVGFDPFIEIQKNRTYRLIKYLAILVQKSHYNRYRRIEACSRNPSILNRFRYLIFEEGASRIFSKLPGVGAMLRRVFSWVNFGTIKKILEVHEPCLFFSTDVFDYYDTPLLSEAKKSGIPTLGMVRSWDNCWSKGRLLVVPDWLLVNNPTIAEEVVSLHGMPSDRITVCGMPQFDVFKNQPRITREDFFKNMGLDPDKKLILFAPAGKLLSDSDEDIAKILVDAIDKGSIKQSSQLLVRNHPNHPADLRYLEGKVVVEIPGKIFSPGNVKAAELTRDDSEHLADTLFHSDVVIYVATTLGIDALVYNKPQIIVDFDGSKVKDYWLSVRRYHDEDHMKKMIACGGVRVAKTQEELVASVNQYLENPSTDDAGRKKMFRQQIYFDDGKSGERVANAVLEKITSACSPT